MRHLGFLGGGCVSFKIVTIRVGLYQSLYCYKRRARDLATL